MGIVSGLRGSWRGGRDGLRIIGSPGRGPARAAASDGPRVGFRAMIFDLPADTQLLQQTVRDFASAEVAPAAEELDRTKSFPYEIVAKMGDARLDGDPVPRGGRRLGRHDAAVRDRGRGADASGLLGRDHALRAHLARHAARVPVRLRRAEGAPDARPLRRPQARGVRPDRARGGLGRRQHEDARDARRRRLGDQRRQAVHHQRRHGHLRARRDHRRDRRGRDLEPDRRERARPATSRARRTARWAGTRPTRGR